MENKKPNVPAPAESLAKKQMPIRSETIVHKVTDAATGTVTSVDLQGLQSITQRQIVGIAVRVADSSGDRRSLNGNPLLPLPISKRAFLSVALGADNKISKLPIELLSFDRFQNSNLGYYPIRMRISNPKVTLDISTWTGTTITTTLDLEVTYYYEED